MNEEELKRILIQGLLCYNYVHNILPSCDISKNANMKTGTALLSFLWV
jgi:hypothetical protein